MKTPNSSLPSGLNTSVKSLKTPPLPPPPFSQKNGVNANSSLKNLSTGLGLLSTNNSTDSHGHAYNLHSLNSIDKISDHYEEETKFDNKDLLVERSALGLVGNVITSVSGSSHESEEGKLNIVGYQ